MRKSIALFLIALSFALLSASPVTANQDTELIEEAIRSVNFTDSWSFSYSINQLLENDRGMVNRVAKRLVDDPDPITSAVAGYIRLIIGDAPREAVIGLLEQLGSDDPAEREAAMYLINYSNRGYYWANYQLITEAFLSLNVPEKICLIDVIIGVVPDEEAIPVLESGVYSTYADIRQRSTSALGWLCLYRENISTLHRDAVIEILIGVLNDDPDENTRLRACEALETCGINESSIHALWRAFDEDSSNQVRGEALYLLAGNVEDERIRDNILLMLRDPDSTMRDYATGAISQIEVDDEIIDEVCFLLDENVPTWRFGVSDALYGALKSQGQRACRAVPTLTGIVEQHRTDTVFAIETLGCLGECADDAVPAIANIMMTGLEHEVVAAINALGDIGGQASQYLPKFMSIASEESPYGWEAFYSRPFLAINALGEMQDARENVIPLLQDLLVSLSNESMEITVHLALYKLDSDADEHLKAILTALYSHDEFRAAMALWAAGRIGAPADVAGEQIKEVQRRYPPSDMLYPWDEMY